MQKKLLRLVVLLIVLTGIGLSIIFHDQLDVSIVENWVNEAGAAGPIVFMLVFVVGAICFFPGSVLTLAGGALFGPVMGSIYNVTGATMGAFCSFLIARYLAASFVEKKTGGRLQQIKKGVESEGWRFVAFVRLVPLFPFNVVNYALGLTKINSFSYLITTFVCMIPGCIAYTYVGYTGREAFAGNEAVIQKVMLAIAFVAIVSFLPRLISRMRQRPMHGIPELKEKIDAG